MENNNEQEKVIIKYSSYTPAQKRATQRYRQNNKEKVNQQRKKYYEDRKERDPKFLEYKRAKAKEYYNKKKAERHEKKQDEQVPVEQPVHQEKQEEQKVEPVIVKKPRRERKPKKEAEIIVEEIKEIPAEIIKQNIELGNIDNKGLKELETTKGKRQRKQKAEVPKEEMPIIEIPKIDTESKPVINVKKCFRKK